jgi:glycosyltransferase involved in cell wall biosynthesis
MEKKIKILYVISSLNLGGAQIVLLNLINNIDYSKYSPILCVLSHGELINKVDPSVPIIFNDIQAKNPINIAIINDAINEYRPDIIDIFNRDIAGIWVHLALLLHHKHEYKLIQSLHTSEYYVRSNFKAKILHKLSMLFDPNILSFITVSRYQSQYYEKTGISAKKIIEIPNGIDLISYTNIVSNQETRNLIRGKFGFSENDIVIGMVSNLRKIKRHDLMLEAMKGISHKYQNVYCVIIGDGEEKERIVTKIAEYNLEGQIRLLGYLENSAPYYSIMDIFLCCSDSESFSNSIVEAMASGLPVISTACGGPSEIIENNNTGILVPINDINKIEYAIEILLNSPQMRIDMGNNGKTRALDLYSVDRMIKNREDLYFSIVFNRENNVAN